MDLLVHSLLGLLAKVQALPVSPPTISEAKRLLRLEGALWLIRSEERKCQVTGSAAEVIYTKDKVVVYKTLKAPTVSL